jgi:hypothetical protein
MSDIPSKEQLAQAWADETCLAGSDSWLHYALSRRQWLITRTASITSIRPAATAAL